MDKNAIIKKWDSFLQMPFPEIRDSKLLTELTSIDSFSAGCITRYIGGNLDQECIQVLKQSITDLSHFLKELSVAEKTYFIHLHEIINDIKELNEF